MSPPTIELLAHVWRAVGRQAEIGTTATAVFKLLQPHLPADALLLRRLDSTRGLMETVAAVGTLAGRANPADTAVFADWASHGDVRHVAADSTSALPVGTLPPGMSGEVLAGPVPGAVVVFVARNLGTFQPTHTELVVALLEPFAALLENDRRLHELVVKREAAEADRRSLLTRLGRHDICDTIVGAETGLRLVFGQVELVAPSDAPVLLLGETGSGKEVVARAVHGRSRRAGGPFLRVNCGAIPPELVDSELFGHERGSFTGAVGMRKGWFERADGGTLFLDEVGELPAAAQVRLLRIAQDGTFERVGGERSLKVDVRLIAATHRDLPQLVRAGTFREDLWYRLAVFPIRLPPLRERPEDVPALAAHFAERAAQRLGSPKLVPSAEDLRQLVAYPWPGNVRELAAVIERAAILGEGRRLEVGRALGPVTPTAPMQPTMSVSPTEDFLTLDAAMRRHIEAALARTRGRVEGPDGAARLLGINPHTLRARMRKLGIEWQQFRRAA